MAHIDLRAEGRGYNLLPVCWILQRRNFRLYIEIEGQRTALDIAAPVQKRPIGERDDWSFGFSHCVVQPKHCVGIEIGRIISFSMGDSIIVRSQNYGSVLPPTAVLLFNDCPRITPAQ
jgi:hypothetical protein